jgi:glucosamine-6-phosphate deaminase
VPAEVRVFADAEELGKRLADHLLGLYGGFGDRPFLLGCPGGRSLRTTYRALAARRRNLGRLVVVMMDEYVVDGAAVSADAHHSCRRFAQHELVEPLGLRHDQVWIPDPADAAAYDEQIAAAGGIEVFLLASGASDGHVAFVAPGSPRGGRTALVALAESTRRDNLATFPEFSSVDDVPPHGVSVGLGTIGAARRCRLVLHGRDKQVRGEAAARARPVRCVLAGERRPRRAGRADLAGRGGTAMRPQHE